MTAQQARAIKLFTRENGLLPQLSTHPVYYFTRIDNGSEETHNISEIIDWYKRELKEAARERAREKRLQKKSNH